MPSIDIHHAHSQPLPETRAALERVVEKIHERLDVASAWRDTDTLEFSRPGVEGRIVLQEGQVRVQVELGWLLSPLKGMVEGEILRVLQRELA